VCVCVCVSVRVRVCVCVCVCVYKYIWDLESNVKQMCSPKKKRESNTQPNASNLQMKEKGLRGKKGPSKTKTCAFVPVM
jgi:hypothetical protein